MATAGTTANVGGMRPNEPYQDDVHAESTDDISSTYTITSPCVIAEFAFYQPSGATVTVTRRLTGTANRDIPLLSDNSSTSGVDLSGRRLSAGDKLLITIDNTSGYKGYDLVINREMA